MQLVDRGWLHASVSDGANTVELRASYLSDALADFLSSVTVLLEGQGEATVVWYEEPGQYQWRLIGQGREITVQIFWAVNPPRRGIGQGEIVFSAKEDILRLARQIRRVFTLLDTPDYMHVWGHAYPRGWVERLGKAIKKTSHR